MHDMLTVDDVADILNVSRQTVLRLPLRRFRYRHRVVRFARQDVDAFIQAMTEVPDQ